MIDLERTKTMYSVTMDPDKLDAFYKELKAALKEAGIEDPRSRVELIAMLWRDDE